MSEASEVLLAPVAAVRVSESLLSQLFDAFRIWEKVESGVLSEILGSDLPTLATADWCAGGISYYTRIQNAAGLSVARVHYLSCPSQGAVPFPSYILVGNTRLFRVGHVATVPNA